MVQEHLEWARQREHPVAEWKRLHDEEGLSYAKIAERYPVSITTVKYWCRGGAASRPQRRVTLRRLTADAYARMHKGDQRCRLCRIILAESVDAKYPEPPVGDYCWDCRTTRPKEVNNAF
jgi:hypothetical protein